MGVRVEEGIFPRERENVFKDSVGFGLSGFEGRDTRGGRERRLKVIFAALARNPPILYSTHHGRRECTHIT